MIYLWQITSAQRAHVCNGCGPRSWKRTIPTWHGVDACCQHDLAYWVGGDEEDRAEADHALYSDLIARAKPAWLGARMWMRFLSWCFYRSVRHEGARYFHYGVPRTLMDLKDRA